MFEACYGGTHAEHEKGIVEIRDFRVEEGEGCFSVGDAAGYEELGKDLRDACGGCQSSGCGERIGNLFGKLPALIGALAGAWTGVLDELRGSPIDRGRVDFSA